MDAVRALGVLGILANENGLRVVRHLVECGREGTSVPRAARATGIAPDKLHGVFEDLRRSSLGVCAEEGPQGGFAVDFGVLQELVHFLTSPSRAAITRPHAPMPRRDEAMSFFRS